MCGHKKKEAQGKRKSQKKQVIETGRTACRPKTRRKHQESVGQEANDEMEENAQASAFIGVSRGKARQDSLRNITFLYGIAGISQADYLASADQMIPN